MATEQSQSRPASQKLPAGLAGVLNPSDDNRDSAYYSSTDASSKRAFNLDIPRPSWLPLPCSEAPPAEC